MNIENLRDNLIDTFTDLKNGNLSYGKAKELSNMAGRIILTSKVELEYNKHMKIERKIDFLETKK